MERRVVTYRSAFRNIGPKVRTHLRLREKLYGVERAIDLRFGLKGVSAVNEEGGLVFQDYRATRGACETGKPCEPVPMRRHGFVLEGVALWNDKSVEAKRVNGSS